MVLNEGGKEKSGTPVQNWPFSSQINCESIILNVLAKQSIFLSLFNPITCPGILSNKIVRRGGIHPPFLGNYTADHPEIRYAYESDHSD